MNTKIYDTIIIGSGPAGLSASVYAQRGGLDFLCMEKYPLSGGQLVNTGDIENYLGFSAINGFELSQKFYEHAKSVGTNFVNKEIVEVLKENNLFTIKTVEDECATKTVIVATGANPRKLGVLNEESFVGKGVSYCAHCDGAFYREKTVVVVGGGDTALSDAIYLSQLCKKVYLVHRRSEFRGADVLVKRAEKAENIEFIMNSTVSAINGDKGVESVNLLSTDNNTTKEIATDGIFICVGTTPETKLFKGFDVLDKSGFIKASESCETAEKGLFVAGDVRTKPLRQIVTAVADGANAVSSVQDYLRKNDK